MSSYTYTSVTKNGINLYIIKTTANNIQPKNANRSWNLTTCPNDFYGINATWFNLTPSNDNSVLNIAMYNGSVVGSNNPNYCGEINDIGEHVIAYTSNSNNTLKYQHALHLSEISGLGGGGSGSWAIGGAAISLGNSNWEENVGNTFSVLYLNNTTTARTAIVANTNSNDIYLIVGKATSGFYVSDFCTAIQQYLGISDTSSYDHTYYKGLFLDGGGSSELVCDEVTCSGDGRTLTGVLLLRRNM